MNNEVWKDVSGFEGRYQVSNLGRILSVKRYGTGCAKSGIIMKPRIDKDGYHKITLKMPSIQKQTFIHRIVAQTFIPNVNNKPQVNHINGIKTDNRIENLEWATASENNKHAFRVLGRVHPRGTLGKRLYSKAKKVRVVCPDNIELLFDSIADASRELKLSRTSLSWAFRKGKSHMGYKIQKP